MLTDDELATAIRNGLRRATLTSLDWSDKDHLRGAFSGMVGHQPKNVVVPHTFGFQAVPMPGASALLLALAGRSDSLHVLGFDDPRYRPNQNPGNGSTTIYDAYGDAVSIVQNNLSIKHASKITLQVGGITLVMTTSGIAISGGTITHDGHAIDKTHEHTNVTPGIQLTGPPP